MRAACPGLALSGIQLLGTGFGSTVVETNTGIILRPGRTAASARGHAIEAAVLPVLAPLLPVAVPVPSVFCLPTAALPFGVIGYERLSGQPCQPEIATAATARDLGVFLAALHQTGAGRLPAMPDQDDIWQSWHVLRDATEPVLRHWLGSKERQRVSRWWDQFLADQQMRHYPPAVRHGDLWYRNLLIQPDGNITAVLDWEAVAIADPAQDLALARYLGPSFTATVLDNYRSHGGTYDRQVQHRIERHWELRELTGIPLAVSVGDEDEIGECVTKLRAGPILS